MRILLLSLVFLVPLATSAEVYKWVDEKGVVHYTDKPPNPDARPAKLPELQTFKSVPLPETPAPPPAARSPQVAGDAAVQLRITAPAPDETFRSAERTVPVSVSVAPELEEGQQLVYYLDGQAQALPTNSTSFTLSGVHRGSHQISVSLVDETGREIRRSPPVTIHMLPPTAKGAATGSAPGVTQMPRAPRTPPPRPPPPSP